MRYIITEYGLGIQLTILTILALENFKIMWNISFDAELNGLQDDATLCDIKRCIICKICDSVYVLWLGSFISVSHIMKKIFFPL